MRVSWLAGLPALALLVACGGDDFSSAEGTGGTAGSGGASGAAGTAGATSGGSSGNGQGGGAGSGGVTGFGGTGGSVSQPTLPAGCGTQPPMQPLLYSTLDDLSSVLNPVFGDGTGSVVAKSAENDFGTGFCNDGLLLDDAGEYVGFKQIVGATPNFSFTTGTLDLMYRPNYTRTDGADHLIMRAESGAGSMSIRKAGASNKNHFQFTIRDAAGTLAETQIAPAQIPIAQGVWVRLTITWDFSQAATRPVHIYFDGREAEYSSTNGLGPIPAGIRAMPPPNPLQDVTFGDKANQFPSARFDDIKIYGAVVPPM